jgi:hypothetical protein
MSTLDEITKEKQRLGEALARVDAQRDKLTSQLTELGRPSVCSRATARERKQERRSQARPQHRRPLQRGKARIGALRSQNQLASDGARRA